MVAVLFGHSFLLKVTSLFTKSLSKLKLWTYLTSQILPRARLTEHNIVGSLLSWNIHISKPCLATCRFLVGCELWICQRGTLRRYIPAFGVMKWGGFDSKAPLYDVLKIIWSTRVQIWYQIFFNILNMTMPTSCYFTIPKQHDLGLKSI